MKRILVTGAAGFVGSHLVERILARTDATVIGLDNLSTGNVRNVAHLPADRFRLIVGNVTEPLRHDVDEIYHLACPASPVHYQNDPIQTLRTCVEGSCRVLEHARHLGIRVLLASTSEVYGDPTVHPQHEDYWGHVNPVGPHSCYDEGKRCAETLATDFARMHGTQIRIARIFNTYGPRMATNDGRVISNFVTQALRHEPLTVYGDGSHTRSLCYVDDLVKGLMLLMASDEDRPVNLGRPGEISMLALAETVRRLAESRSRIVHRPLPTDDPARREPDVTRALRALAWQPIIDLETGLARTIAHVRNSLSPSVPEAVAS